MDDAGSVLRAARKAAGLTQAELARRAGVTQSVISAYEAGRREPSVATLSRLVDAAGATLRLHVEPHQV
ncbi:MAG TPA: helix-turn-helix transcriptional regulator, partial [Mycobacteriales bacterium]